MKVDPILVLLVAVALGLVFIAPTIEGLDQNGPSTAQPWPSPWLHPTTLNATEEQDRPRPFSSDSYCKRVAGNLANIECADPNGNTLV